MEQEHLLQPHQDEIDENEGEDDNIAVRRGDSIPPMEEPVLCVQEPGVVPGQKRIAAPVDEPEPKRKRRRRGKSGKCCLCETGIRVLKLRPCGHRMCKECVTTIPTRNCPTCKARIDTYLPPHMMGNERWEEGVQEPIIPVETLTDEDLVRRMEEPTVVPAAEPGVVPVQERIVVPVKEPGVLPVQERIVVPVEELSVVPVQERIEVPVDEPEQKRKRKSRRGGKNGKCCLCQTRYHILKLRPCAHRMCKECVTSIITTRNCPTCKARIDTYLPPHMMGNERWEEGVQEPIIPVEALTDEDLVRRMEEPTVVPAAEPGVVPVQERIAVPVEELEEQI